MELVEKLCNACIEIIKSDSIPGFVCVHAHHKALVEPLLPQVVEKVNAWIEKEGTHYTDFNGTRKLFPARTISLVLSPGPKRIMKKLLVSEMLVSDGQENPHYISKVTNENEEEVPWS